MERRTGSVEPRGLTQPVAEHPGPAPKAKASRPELRPSIVRPTIRTPPPPSVRPRPHAPSPALTVRLRSLSSRLAVPRLPAEDPR